MTWLQRYRIHHYVQNSIWVMPLLSMAMAIGAARLLRLIGETTSWKSGVHADTARGVLSTLASAMFTFIVFVSSALLVAVQLASTQLTPRIIAIVFKDPVTKAAMTLFVGAFTFTPAALVQIGDAVPLLTAHLAAYSCLASLGVFLFLIDHVGKSLRPSGALWAVASLGRRVIETVYPNRLAEGDDAPPPPAAVPDGEPACVVSNQKDGVVLAFDIAGLVSLAERANCVIEMVPQVGDFVAAGDPLFRVFQVARRLRAMLENLIETLPPERVPLLCKELARLHRSAERCFTDPEDRALTEVSDFQGVGGKQGCGQKDGRAKEVSSH